MCPSMANQIDPEKWEDRLAEAIGRNVKRARESQVPKVTVAELSARLDEIGHPIKRTVLTNLETGRRSYVPVADILAIARALSVPPISLLAHFGESVEAVPHVHIPPTTFARWFSGAQLPTELAPADPAHLKPWIRAATPYRLQEELYAAQESRMDAADALTDDIDPKLREAYLSQFRSQSQRVIDLEAQLVEYGFGAEANPAAESEEQNVLAWVRRAERLSSGE